MKYTCTVFCKTWTAVDPAWGKNAGEVPVTPKPILKAGLCAAEKIPCSVAVNVEYNNDTDAVKPPTLETPAD